MYSPRHYEIKREKSSARHIEVWERRAMGIKQDGRIALQIEVCRARSGQIEVTVWWFNPIPLTVSSHYLPLPSLLSKGATTV